MRTHFEGKSDVSNSKKTQHSGYKSAGRTPASMGPSVSSDPNWLQMHQALGNQGVMQRVQSRNHFTQGTRPQFTPEERDQKIPDAKNQTGLPDTPKEAMERESRLDLSDVRVHYNSPKPEQFQSLAYAQGNEIHISTGQEKHLPHEAWHIVQQKQGRVLPTLRLNNTPMKSLNPKVQKPCIKDLLESVETLRLRSERNWTNTATQCLESKAQCAFPQILLPQLCKAAVR